MWNKGWLEYKSLEDGYGAAYLLIVGMSPELNHSPIIKNVIKELQMACLGLYDHALIVSGDLSLTKGLFLCKENRLFENKEAFHMIEHNGLIIIESSSDQGIMYGVYHLLLKIVRRMTLLGVNEHESPLNPHRMLNHWDNMDGSVERGYSGNSLFFKKNQLIVDKRLEDYARLLASVGINGIVINNVNVKNEATFLVTRKHRPQLKRLNELLNGYGIRLYLSVNYASTIDIGGLDTADPQNREVQKWWYKQSEELFSDIPDFGGYLVKADSEGRPGPFTYGRLQNEGANMLARSVAPFGGIIIWRCFVYNCDQDWRDKKTDRAKAGFDYFAPLDGKFDSNVVLQIKNGPMDFQVREPVSPLLGAMPNTNQFLEVQMTQEYTGQQRHVCYLVPQWKEVLDHPIYAPDKMTTIGRCVSGERDLRSVGGIVAVSNTGDDSNWTGHDLAGANLFGFARLAWNPSNSADEIAREWSQLYFGIDEQVTEVVVSILMKSWPTYESYTSPLGIGWMVQPNHHFGPNVDGYEYDRWGTYHRADHLAIGVDRTSTGTGFTRQYDNVNQEIYESKNICPMSLLLFFHRLPYDYLLPNGKFLIQHIYDEHFQGVIHVEDMCNQWESVMGHIDSNQYRRISERLDFQLSHAKEWRDVINSYFYRKTGIRDVHSRLIIL